MTVLRASRLIAFLTTLVLYVNSAPAYNQKDLRAAEAFKVALANHVPSLTTDHLKVDIAPRSQQGPSRSNNNNNNERRPPGGRSNGPPLAESHEHAAQERLPPYPPFDRFRPLPPAELPNFMPPAYRSGNTPPRNPASRPNSPEFDQTEIPQIDWNARLASLPQTASLPRFMPQPQRRPLRHRGGSPSPPPAYEYQTPAYHHSILGGPPPAARPHRQAYPAHSFPANTRHSGASGSNHRHQFGGASSIPAHLPPANRQGYMPPARMHMPVPVNSPHRHSGAATGARGSNHLHQSGPSHSPPTSRPSSPSGSSTKSTRQSGKGKRKGKGKGNPRDNGKGVKRPRTRSPSPGPSSNRARH